MPEAEQHLVWNLFSGDPARIATALLRLQPRVQTWSSLLNDLLSYYELEGMAMPYTMEDYERDAQERLLNRMTPARLLQHLSVEQRLAGLTPEQVLARMPLDEIERYLKKRKAAQDQGPPPQSEPPA